MTKKKIISEEKAIAHILNKQQPIDLDENFKEVENVEKEVTIVDVKETKTNKITNKTINYIGRGFNSIQEAYDFVDTDYFKGLGEADQIEYKKWLK